MLGQMPETTKGIYMLFSRFSLRFLDVKRYLNQSFVKTGKLVFFNNDPALDVNRYIGQILLFPKLTNYVTQSFNQS